MSSITKWHCKLCGNYSTDLEEVGRTWGDHLNHHRISLRRYRNFVDEMGGGVSKMRVNLISWSNNIEDAIVTFISQTWGAVSPIHDFTPEERDRMVRFALNGKTLPQALETVNFTFQIEGISRACSHQLVRVRIGSGFTQKGQSDAYYGDTEYVIPPMIEAVGRTRDYLELMDKCSALYRDLFEEGVPYQDARYVLPNAATTTIAWTINLLALKNWCQQRLQNFMQWEINALARMIREEVRLVHPAVADILRPRCELTGSCQAFGNLFSGCGKYPLKTDHDNFLFSADQNKNVRFDPDSVSTFVSNNSRVPRFANHWLERARVELRTEDDL